MAATSNSEVGQRVRSSVQDLGNSCISLVKAGGSCQSNPGDIYSQRDVTDNAHHVSEKVSTEIIIILFLISTFNIIHLHLFV